MTFFVLNYFINDDEFVFAVDLVGWFFFKAKLTEDTLYNTVASRVRI